jgi:hypothetical protein
MRNVMTCIVLGLAAAAAASDGALAQTRDEPPRVRPRPRPPLQIEVAPGPRYYRQCTDWLAVEQRPSGNVIVPQTRCVWALRAR